MAISLIQSHIKSVTGTTSTTQAFGSNVTAGNMILVMASSNNISFNAPTDTQGNTYSVLPGSSTTPKAYYAFANSTGANTVTVSITSSGNFTFTISEWSNVDDAAPIYDTSGELSSGGTSSPSVTLTGDPSQSSMLLVGCISHGTAGVVTTTPGSGFTQLQELEDGTTNEPLNVEYKIFASPTYPSNINWTQSPSASCNAIGYAFREKDNSTDVELEGYRFRDDNGSETTATWRADQDTAVNITTNNRLRLRCLVNATGDPPSAAYALYFKKSTDTDYLPVRLPSVTTPSYVGAGDIAASGTTVSPTLPSGVLAIGDILIMAAESANQTHSISNSNGGTWTQIDTQGVGTAGSTAATRLTLWWSRYNGTQGNPTLADSGDHTIATIVAFRDCLETGDPVHVFNGSTENTDPATLTLPGITTTVDNCMLVCAASDDRDSSLSNWSSFTATSLTSPTERVDGGSSTGNGGGIGIFTAEMPTAGSTSTLTVVPNSGVLVEAMITLALAPRNHYFRITTSSNISTGGSNTTAQLTAPSGKTTSDFATGRIWDDENGAEASDIATDDYAEFEWCIQADPDLVSVGDTYQFRVYRDKQPLDTYTTTPAITIIDQPEGGRFLQFFM